MKIMNSMLLTICLVCSAIAQEDQGEWFAWGELYGGVDYNLHSSQFCLDRSNGSGNLGLRANVYQRDGWELNAKWTHHSCFIGPDAQYYEGVGFEITRTLWGRK